MFCNKCGQQIPDASKFCPVCSNQIGVNDQNAQVPSQYPQNMPYQPAPQAQPLRSKKKFPFVWLIAGMLVLVIAAVGIVFAVRGKGEKSEWQKQLDLGNRYLAELNYEQAIAAFERAIEIKPNNIEAYMGLADAYVAIGDYDAAIAALERGIDQTGAQSLKDYLEELKAERARLEEERHNSDANGGAETPDDTADQTDPTQTGPVFIPWSEAGLEDHVMDWKDANLEVAMREITGITDRDIMLSDVWELTELMFERKSDSDIISDISVLGELVNLTSLKLKCIYLSIDYHNEVKDISALGNLTNLTELWLDNNEISDISALGGLTNLTILSLNQNSIIDINVLGDLTNLTILSLNENNISDISVLGNLTNLEALYLQNNNVSDISVLGNLINLIGLNLISNGIIDISTLGNLTNLQDLYLGWNSISDISVLGNLTDLTNLGLWNNNVSDVSALGNLTNLTELNMPSNNISDISALGNLTDLTWLDLRNNNISDISVLGNLTNLMYLNLEGNPITDYSSVSFVPNLYK